MSDDEVIRAMALFLLFALFLIFLAYPEAIHRG
jgi:hypothetical protein